MRCGAAYKEYELSVVTIGTSAPADKSLNMPTYHGPTTSTRRSHRIELSKEAWIGLGAAVFLAVATATSAPWWWPSDHHTPTALSTSPSVGMSGGCAPFQVFAQNRWAPVGTAIRVAPNVQSEQAGSFPGNMSISVDGWVHGRPAYPTNTAPWNSDVWFHLTDGAGWVSFPGVRATPVGYDPTGLSANGGTPAPSSPSCEGAIQ